MEQKEHKIGERFKDGNTLLETVKSIHCSECFYRAENGSTEPCGRKSKQGPCCPSDRIDKTDVIFKEIKGMKEEKLNKDEHFYILGVPNRGEEVKNLLKSKGVRCPLDIGSYSNEYIIIYVEHNTSLEINRCNEPSLANLITSNWTELKLPYKPKDKELVWAWNDEECYKVLGIYCLEWNSIYETKCRMCCYSNYKHYEGEYPQWAKDALSKLEE